MSVDTITYHDKWGDVITRTRGQNRVLELRWYDTSRFMSDDEFKVWLGIFAEQVENFAPQGCLIDAVQLRLELARRNSRYRDEVITPRYVSAGVSKFAVILPEGRSIPEELDKNLAHSIQTRYFDKRLDAVKWLLA